jgi:hypothetical protein
MGSFRKKGYRDITLEVLRQVPTEAVKIKEHCMSTEAKNIRRAEPLLAELEGAARSQQKTPDELAGEAVQAFLLKRRWQDLLTYAEHKGAESGILEEDVADVVHEWRREQSR